MLAIKIDTPNRTQSQSASQSLYLQPVYAPIPPFPNLLLLLHTSLFSFIWASVTESESRLARTCWSRYAHRCVGFRYREKVGEAEEERRRKRRHHFSSLQSPCGFLARCLARHCSTCGPTFMFFKHLPALFLSLLSPSCSPSASRCCCIMTFTVISLVICKANAANGKIINIKIKL